MNQDFRCGNSAALIGFLYQDCEPEERVQMAEHLAVCSDCAAELEALSATRQQLSSWTPPDTTLGFQLTSTESQVIAGPARWWSQPLPAWAQLAAAVVIFGTGLAIGMARSGSSPVAVAPAPTPAITAKVTDLEQRLQELAGRTAPQPVSHTLDENATNALMKQVEVILNRRDAQWRRDLYDTVSSLLTDQYYQQVNTDKRMREALNRDQFKVGLTTSTSRASD